MSATFDKVKELVVDQLGVDPAEVTPEASFIEDLGSDSLDLAELIMTFEEEFDMQIPEEASEKITTVKEAVAFIEANQ